MYNYRTIVKVLLLGVKGREISHLLLTDSNNLQVDLLKNCIFNDFPALSALSETKINSLDDVYEYCNINNITLPSELITEQGLIAGVEKNFLIDNQLIGDWMKKNNSLLDNVIDYIIRKVQENSILSGFQYSIDFSEIEEEFGIQLNSKYVDCIFNLLSFREEVSDVEVDDTSFDVVLYTDFAPNYCNELEELVNESQGG